MKSLIVFVAGFLIGWVALYLLGPWALLPLATFIGGFVVGRAVRFYNLD